jgi:flagellar basal body-associated protein FliL
MFINGRSEKKSVSLNKILLMATCVIAAVIVLVTVIGLATNRAVPAYGLRHQDPLPPDAAAQNTTNSAASPNESSANDLTQHGMPAGTADDDPARTAYTGLGQLRAVTKGAKKNTPGISVVISPWLSYSKGDNTFYEELDRKSRSIKAVITSYFSRHTERELLTRGEIAVKADLLREINSMLVLGKISAVYFNEYMFLE